MNEGRRLFLKSFAALAAAAVTPNVLAKLAQDDTARLMAAMRTGAIEDQWFLFNGPIVINVDNLIIRRCVFKFNCPFGMREAITLDAKNLYMHSCHIDCGPNGADYAIRVTPQDEDMSTTFQSALSGVSSADGPAIYLPQGTYRLKPLLP